MLGQSFRRILLYPAAERSAAIGADTMTKGSRRLPRLGRAIAKYVFVVAAAVIGCLPILLSSTTIARADSPPDQQQVQFAARNSDLMLATLFAALLQEFAETTPTNVEEGK